MFNARAIQKSSFTFLPLPSIFNSFMKVHCASCSRIDELILAEFCNLQRRLQRHRLPNCERFNHHTVDMAHLIFIFVNNMKARPAYCNLTYIRSRMAPSSRDTESQSSAILAFSSVLFIDKYVTLLIKTEGAAVPNSGSRLRLRPI